MKGKVVAGMTAALLCGALTMAPSAGAKDSLRVCVVVCAPDIALSPGQVAQSDASVASLCQKLGLTGAHVAGYVAVCSGEKFGNSWILVPLAGAGTTYYPGGDNVITVAAGAAIPLPPVP